MQPTRYTFGSMSLGADLDRLEDDVRTARRAMDAGVWFHSSPTYHRGFAFMVLRMAFDEDRAKRPPVILKVRDGSARLLRFEAEDACRRLGIDGIDVAQLVSMSPDLVEELNGDGGPVSHELARLRDEGVIRQAVLFLTRDNADAAVEAAGSPLIDGVTFYWNALQRDCTRSAWNAIRSRRIPVLALRTLGGGPKDERRAEIRGKVSRLIREAGCRSETQFALWLAESYPEVRTTIGGTADPGHLDEFLAAADQPQALPEEILHSLDELLLPPDDDAQA